MDTMHLFAGIGGGLLADLILGHRPIVAVEWEPFTVPNFVRAVMPEGRREDGFTESPCYALNDLSEEALDRLCRQFTDAVFEKAGKQKPPQVRRG